MSRIDELNAQIDAAEEQLLSLKKELRDEIVAAAPWKADDILTVKRHGECKVVRVEAGYGKANPVVVKRLKGGEWGNREHKLYSRDLA